MSAEAAGGAFPRLAALRRGGRILGFSVDGPDGPEEIREDIFYIAICNEQNRFRAACSNLYKIVM